MNKVYIVSAKRTPIGSFGGMLSTISAPKLGQKAIEEALIAADLDPGEVEEVFMGNVVSANMGQAPARQSALFSGIPDHVPCTTINKVCASGLKSVMIGAQTIMLGMNDIVVAGGMENMSQIPFYVPKARFGYKYGHGALVDGLAKDGLEDVYDQCAMGVCADESAASHKISRAEQDAYAIESYKRSAAAAAEGLFKEEIVPIELPQRRGSPVWVEEDEEYKRVKFDKIPVLRPAFSEDGTGTAANASTINDGASAVILASEQAIKARGLTPLARIVSFADAALKPKLFTMANTKAVPKALNLAGMQLKDIDFFEINEAFAVVPILFEKAHAIGYDRMNVHGGAVSLGHPLGASGTRILTTLIHILKNKNAQTGLASICNGGGGASAMVIQRT
jgi:acetyl-CoA C-acetyltransferase